MITRILRHVQQYLAPKYTTYNGQMVATIGAAKKTMSLT